MKRMFGKTRIVWDDVFEEYKCEACQAILYYQFDYRFCPYCRKKITWTDRRKAQTQRYCGRGVILR